MTEAESTFSAEELLCIPEICDQRCWYGLVVSILLCVANTCKRASMQDRLGKSDQGEVEDDDNPEVELIPVGVGEEEKRNSRPGLFQLALDVPGVGLEPLG